MARESKTECVLKEVICGWFGLIGVWLLACYFSVTRTMVGRFGLSGAVPVKWGEGFLYLKYGRLSRVGGGLIRYSRTAGRTTVHSRFMKLDAVHFSAVEWNGASICYRWSM